ncbi:MAG: peptide ABC transporter substrate-binding protein [Anaerolineales bacterium]|nr:peptide ABC transporter substrate-binding protein [Anaerolineales bacterium]
MKRFRWQILTAAVGVILVLLLILALRGTNTPVLPNAPETRGGEYSEALIGGMQRLNPVLDVRNAPDRDVDRLVFSGLLRFDSTGVPVQDLAEGWLIENGTTYYFRIRDDAFWHDGEPVTAQDVVYTFGLIQDNNYPGRKDLAALWRSVKVEALSAKEVRFTLSEPYAPFLDYLTTGLLPYHLLNGVGVKELDALPFNLKPVGSGPFTVDTLIVEEEKILGVTLRPFEKYYGAKPALEKVDLLYYPTRAAAFEALQSGEVMGLGGLTSAELGTALTSSAWNIYTARLPQASMVFLNLKNDDVPFLGQRDVRRALLLALNRQRIIDTVLAGQAVQAAGPILPGTWAEDPNMLPLAYNPDEAARLLDEAGWKIPAGAVPGTDAYVRSDEDGAALQFTLVYAEDPRQEAIATALQDQWAKIGVRVLLRKANMRSLLEDNLAPRTYQAALVDLDLAPYPDPDPYPFWHQTQSPDGQNYSQLDDRAISELLEEARITMDREERARLYRTFQYRFVYQLPALFLWHPVYNYAVDARIAGVAFGPLFDPSDRLGSMNEWYAED